MIMKNIEIITIISCSFIGILLLLFLCYLLFLLIKKYSTEAKEKHSKLINFEKFIINLKNSLDFFCKKKVGALIILKGKEDISSNFATNGVFVNAEFSSELLNNIFCCKRSQLHDGATIIESNYRISYVSIILTIPKVRKPIRNLGTRHNVASAIATKSDAIAIVVSEISGIITVFFGKNETEKIKRGNKNNYNDLIEKIRN